MAGSSGSEVGRGDGGGGGAAAPPPRRPAVAAGDRGGRLVGAVDLRGPRDGVPRAVLLSMMARSTLLAGVTAAVGTAGSGRLGMTTLAKRAGGAILVGDVWRCLEMIERGGGGWGDHGRQGEKSQPKRNDKTDDGDDGAVNGG